VCVFVLAVLPKLCDIKSSDSEHTLLQYIVMIVKRAKPDYIKFPSLLPSLKSASKVSLVELKNMVAKLNMDVKNAQSAVNLVLQEGHTASDKFANVMPPFLQHAQEKVRDCEKQLVESQAVFGKLVEFFNLSPKAGLGKDSSVLFQALLDFQTQFKCAIPVEKSRARKLQNAGRKIVGGQGGKVSVAALCMAVVIVS